MSENETSEQILHSGKRTQLKWRERPRRSDDDTRCDPILVTRPNFQRKIDVCWKVKGNSLSAESDVELEDRKWLHNACQNSASHRPSSRFNHRVMAHRQAQCAAALFAHDEQAYFTTIILRIVPLKEIDDHNHYIEAASELVEAMKVISESADLSHFLGYIEANTHAYMGTNRGKDLTVYDLAKDQGIHPRAGQPYIILHAHLSCVAFDQAGVFSLIDWVDRIGRFFPFRQQVRTKCIGEHWKAKELREHAINCHEYAIKAKKDNLSKVCIAASYFVREYLPDMGFIDVLTTNKRLVPKPRGAWGYFQRYRDFVTDRIPPNCLGFEQSVKTLAATLAANAEPAIIDDENVRSGLSGYGRCRPHKLAVFFRSLIKKLKKHTETLVSYFRKIAFKPPDP